MLIKEYRIVLPMSVEEYQIGQLFSVAEASMSETGGGDGVEVIANEPFTKQIHPPDPALLCGEPAYVTGQYTHKRYHLAQKVPGVVRTLAPTSALIFNEYAWNAYPYCRTIISNDFLVENFKISVESFHSTDLKIENPHRLDCDELKVREVVEIDIANFSPEDKDYNPEEDPTLYRSKKTGRGPLKPAWWKTEEYKGPVMCAYKLVKCLCKMPLLQGRLERMIHRQETRLFANFHRQVFCWMDRWAHLNLNEIRKIEDETREKLEKQRKCGALRGHKGEE